MKKVCNCLLTFAILVYFVGCKTVNTVYVPVKDSTNVSHQETEREKDSLIIDRTTIIKEADSSLLAQLESMGIKIDKYEGILFVLQREITQKVKELEIVQSDTATKVKEVPIPYPVEINVPVEKELTKWQKFKMKGFWWLAIGFVGYLLWRTRKLWVKIIKK